MTWIITEINLDDQKCSAIYFLFITLIFPFPAAMMSEPSLALRAT